MKGHWAGFVWNPFSPKYSMIFFLSLQALHWQLLLTNVWYQEMGCLPNKMCSVALQCPSPHLEQTLHEHWISCLFLQLCPRSILRFYQRNSLERLQLGTVEDLWGHEVQIGWTGSSFLRKFLLCSWSRGLARGWFIRAAYRWAEISVCALGSDCCQWIYVCVDCMYTNGIEIQKCHN